MNWCSILNLPGHLTNTLLSSPLSGLDKIEFLQSHDNLEIYQKVYDIIEKFFGSEEDDTNLVPQVENDQFAFGAGDQANMYNNQGGFQF